ncbi:MAG TPA: hypothetical protein VJ770_03320 [Stellaceae bacterium]|nr:hypothetical protein [Stellaceae bacterium]
MSGSPVFERASATGLKMANWQGVILVNMMVVVRDTRAGLRINARCQVVDMNGEVIRRGGAWGRCLIAAISSPASRRAARI